MKEQLVVEIPGTKSRERRSKPNEIWFRPWLALAGVSAVLILSSEFELLNQLDSMSLYMTYGEIALDASLALLIIFGMAFVWWLCCLLLAGAMRLNVRSRKYYTLVFWRIALLVPTSYFVLGLCNNVRVGISPHWHPEQSSWIGLSFLAVIVCAAIVCRINIATIQDFCRTRLLPFVWLHVLLAGVGTISLWAHGVYPFHDYQRVGKPASASNLPDIYLITIDALRAADTSVYGYNLPTTPNLAKFAERSFTFDYFFANSNITTPTTTSIETGKLPWSHRIFQLGGFLRGPVERQNLAEILHQYGYYTAVVASNYLATPIQHRTLESYDAMEYSSLRNLSGMWSDCANFVGLNSRYTLDGPILTRLVRLRILLDNLIWSGFYPAPAEPVFDRAQALIERHDINQPRFLWTHVYPPHDPYLPPSPFLGHFLPGEKLTHNSEFVGLQNSGAPKGVSAEELRARYDESVLYVDNAVGKYLDWLDRTGRLDHSIVIVSADHGESFEHHWFVHGGRYLYDGLIHIPLLIHLPGQKRSARIDYAAQQVDLLPTLLDLVGGNVPNWTDGISLKPLLEGKTMEQRYIYSMNLEPNRELDPITKGTVAIIDDEFKYVNYLGSSKEDLYRYKTDLKEEHNLILSDPETGKRMRELLLKKLNEVNDRNTPNN